MLKNFGDFFYYIFPKLNLEDGASPDFRPYQIYHKQI